MDTKIGVNNFSAAQQVSSLKADNSNSLAAGELKKALGDNENIGEMLNKIADPNWVDPAKVRRVGSNTLDKDAFLKLMLTQMKYQDPTNPLKSHEMAAHMAQFTSVEQMMNMNQNLEALAAMQKPQRNFDVLAYIGKKISGDSSVVNHQLGDTNHEIDFNLGKKAAKAEITIVDGTGTVVKKYEMSDLKEGKNSIEWDGAYKNGGGARPGQYRVRIEAFEGNGKKVAVHTKFDGLISGVKYTAEGPLLMVGSRSVKLKEVKEIADPSIGPKKAEPTGKGNAKVKEVKDGVSDGQVAKASDLLGIAMSKKLSNEITGDKKK